MQEFWALLFYVNGIIVSPAPVAITLFNMQVACKVVANEIIVKMSDADHVWTYRCAPAWR